MKKQPESDPEQARTEPHSPDRSESVADELEKLEKEIVLKAGRYGASYADVYLLAKGSFGELRIGRDAVLGREVAIKSLKTRFKEDDLVVNRFLKEARGTAQLEHPNIMPVHEMGISDEFGVYYTMKKVEGENLREILDKLKTDYALYEKRYPLNVLLEIFLSVCNGVAFAHSKGVVHRDLKPANIMAGKYGEVLILDWGLVKELGEHDVAADHIQLLMDEIDTYGTHTLDGAVSGTPNYMSPEQAKGHIHEVGIQSDVYSLGAILYHILTYYPPFERAQIEVLLDNVKSGNFTPPRKRFPRRRIPRELEAITLKAMSHDPQKRYDSVELLAQDVRNYIGHLQVTAYRSSRSEKIWKYCQRNPVLAGMVLASVASLLLTFGGQQLMRFGAYRDNLKRAIESQRSAVALMEQSIRDCDILQVLSQQFELKAETADEKKLRLAFAENSSGAAAMWNVAQMLCENIPMPYRNRPAVHNVYADIMEHRIEFALSCRQYDLARQWLETLRFSLQEHGMPVTDKQGLDLAEVERRIEGRGRLSIRKSDGVVRIKIIPLEDPAGDVHLTPGDALGTYELPVTIEDIKKGSYVLEVECSDGRTLPYPVYIRHGESRHVTFNIPASIPDDMVYVPDGEFIFGGEDSRFYRERTRRLQAFFISRYEVTVKEYLEFWLSLKDSELQSEYMSLIRFQRQDRRYNDAWSAEGVLLDDRLHLEYPVVGITREAAEAFCRWKSEQTGRRIRLPMVEEWEKAARGVDGRRYVWGNRFSAEADLALTRANPEGKKRYPLWAPPGSFPHDVSVFGAYDMAGNVREMTSTPLPASSEFYQLKGGSASTPENFLPCSNSSDTPVLPSDVGFRYVQEIPELW